jgi:hypothetical protein
MKHERERQKRNKQTNHQLASRSRDERRVGADCREGRGGERGRCQGGGGGGGGGRGGGRGGGGRRRLSKERRRASIRRRSTNEALLARMLEGTTTGAARPPRRWGRSSGSSGSDEAPPRRGEHRKWREGKRLAGLSLTRNSLPLLDEKERERERESRESGREWKLSSVFFLSSFSSPSLHFPIFPLVSSLPRATPFPRSLSLPKPHPPPPPKATNDGRHYAVHADLAPRRRRRPQARLRCCSPRRWRRRARRQAAALVPWYVSAAVLSPRRSGRLSRRARGPCAGGGAVELNQNV